MVSLFFVCIIIDVENGVRYSTYMVTCNMSTIFRRTLYTQREDLKKKNNRKCLSYMNVIRYRCISLMGWFMYVHIDTQI